jgi:predicted GNAT family acetyltransferase
MMRSETFSWFESRKVKYVCLAVMSDNKHARRIYEKWGFSYFSTVMWKTGVR